MVTLVVGRRLRGSAVDCGSVELARDRPFNTLVDAGDAGASLFASLGSVQMIGWAVVALRQGN